VEAAEAVDRIFWDQVSDCGYDTWRNLSVQPDALLQKYADLVRLHYGPWDRRADNEPFLGRSPKPEGAAFYPADLSRRELERWIDAHPADREAFLSPVTVVRRQGSGLVAVPYSQKYAPWLERASAALRAAVPLSECPGLARFLAARAEAFTSNDYLKSEMAWMDTGECPVEVAIGPYEFEEDRLNGYKASFAAIIALKDYGETAKIAKLGQYAGELVAALPLPDALRDRVEPVKGQPITIAHEVFAAGDYRAAFQVRALTLPNDERVRVSKGTKHIIFKNVVDAKFEHLFLPLARRVLAEDQAAAVTADAYFDILLLWQLAHGLAPKLIALPGGGNIQPRLLLRQRAGVVEAARAEAVALLNGLALVKKGVLPPAMGSAIPIAYLASVFEDLRVSAGDTRGLAKLVVYNALAAGEAFRYDPTSRRFFVDDAKLPAALAALVTELLSIEVQGDYERAGRLVVEHGIVPPEVRAKLDELANLPIDLAPRYTIQK
jgi:hypothetical protein